VDLADETIASAGASGTRAFTAAFGDDYTGLVFALRPGAAPASGGTMTTNTGYWGP
jgi:hypothetical protein